MGDSIFSAMELDAIGEIMNISMGASATAVSTLLGTKVDITTPTVAVQDRSSFEFRKLEPAVGVEISYVEGLSGKNVMMFARNDVRIIVGMLMGMEMSEEAFELDEINMSAICEVMNQMMGSSATSLSEFLGYTINISTPVSFPVEDEGWFKDRYFPGDDQMVVVHFLLEIEGKLKNEFLNIMSVDLAKRLIEPFRSSILASSQETVQEIPEVEEKESVPEPQPESPAPEPVASQPEIPSPAPAEVPSQPVQETVQPEVTAKPAVQPEPVVQPQPVPPAQEMVNGQMPMGQMPVGQMPAGQVPQQMPYMQPVYQSSMDPTVLQLINQMQQSQMQMLEFMKDMKENKENKDKGKNERSGSLIRPASPLSLTEGNGNGEEDIVNQEMLMKVPLELSVEVGRTKKLVKEILELTHGSLVVLDKMAGEQADIYVNGQCIAKGDIVVVEDNFGIRITEIIARNLNPEIL